MDKEDRVVVADNGLSAILVFDPAGKLLKTIDGKRPNQKSGSESTVVKLETPTYLSRSRIISAEGVAFIIHLTVPTGVKEGTESAHIFLTPP